MRAQRKPSKSICITAAPSSWIKSCASASGRAEPALAQEDALAHTHVLSPTR